MEDMPGPFFYARSTGESMSDFGLQPKAGCSPCSPCGDPLCGPAQRGTAGLRIPEPGSLSALFSHRIDQILNGAEHGQSQDSKY